MAFVVETGQGLVDSNAYTSVEYVDAYHADRGHTAWTNFNSTLKQTAIVRATDYVDKRFGRRYRGLKMSQQQALEWPRLDAFDDSGFVIAQQDQVPRLLQQAISEYALRAALLGTGGELVPDAPFPVPLQDMGLLTPPYPPTGDVVSGQVSSKKDIVGPLESDVAYQTPAELARFRTHSKDPMNFVVSDFIIPEYPAADLMLERLIRSNTSRRLSRG